jgi:NADPH:quinone reductase-like Zn-dependent oxidoreductase/SAM-dependent methyltransferase/acyl carrier protein
LTAASSGRLVGDIRVFRADGELAIEIIGFQCQAVPRVRRRETTPIEKCFLVTRWRFKPLPNSAPFAVPAGDFDLTELFRAAEAAGEQPGHDATSEWVERGVQYGNRLTLAYIAEGLRARGFRLQAGDRVEPADLVSSGKLVDRLRPHFERCARFLFETHGIAELAGPRWHLSRAVESVNLDRLWSEALADHLEGYRQYRLVEVCGSRLKEVWSGALDPLELLFSSECLDLLEHGYQNSTTSRNANLFIQQLIARVVAVMPENRPIRVLEVGAGTAGTAVYAAPVLPPHRSEYWFTDISPFFMARAEDKLRRYDFVRYQSLDIEQPLAEQKIPEGIFDVVIASHVLHATHSVESAMRRCREALVDGGILIATELCRTPPVLELVFGMTQGWWYFREDPARSDSPHLPRHKWLSILERAGFEQSCASGTDQDRQIVLAGRNPRRSHRVAPPPMVTEALPPEKKWIIFADRGGCAAPLVARLRERGLRCIEVLCGNHGDPGVRDQIRIDPADDQAIVRVQDTCRLEFSGDYSIVYLWALDVPARDEPSEGDIEAAETLACHCAMDVLRAFGSEGSLAPRRLILVTRGAQVVSSENDSAAYLQSPLLGLARVAANELTALRIRMVDLDPAGEDSADTLWAELVADDHEEEVAWRGPQRFIPRLEFKAPAAALDPNPRAHGTVPFKLAVQQLGNLNSLELREIPTLSPRPDEIQIDIHWAPLNFKDIIWALSRNAIAEHVELGMECAGIVREVGESVENFQVGDRIVCCGSGCIRSRINVHAERAAKVPEGLSMLAAVSMPVAFITADYALRKVGRLREGERVLIHSAAGGVGLAAVQIARQVGAEIYATASSALKRDLLAKLGAKHVMDSRTLDFADEIRNETNGEGIDVVLNSLAGQAMIRSLATLRPYGRFLELGKRDFLENTKIGLWPLRNNVSYHAIDVEPFLSGPPHSGVLSPANIMAMAAEGLLSPLPVDVFPVARATDAFRFMAQGSHVGKVVLDMTQHDRQIRREPRPVQLRPTATYLVTGGLGGIGLVVARWLVEHGAKHLMLVSRSGPQTDAAREFAAEMEQHGVETRIRQCDVGDFAQLQAVFSEINDQMPELAGVFHLAMVLDDSALVNMNRSRFRRVMHPKFRGACNLHRLCRNIPLDLFVLFSSASASNGIPGQSNYAAANAGLDGLARFRREIGLPASSIAWGVLGDTGYAASRPEILQHLRRNGYYEIGLADFRKALELALGADEPVQGVARVDWHREVRMLRARGNRQTLLSALADVQDAETAAAPGLARETILAAAPDQRARLIHDLLRDPMAAVLGTGADKILSDKPLTDLGFDSLMAIELAGQVESQTGVTLPLRALGEDVTLARLSELLARALSGSNDAPTGQPDPVAEHPRVNT